MRPASSDGRRARRQKALLPGKGPRARRPTPSRERQRFGQGAPKKGGTGVRAALGFSVWSGLSKPRAPPLSAHDVAGPGPALHQAEYQQDADGQVLQRIAQASDDAVHRRARAGVHGIEPAQHHGEAYENHEDDDARQAHAGEAAQVPDADLPGVLQAHEAQRYGAERRHQVELDGAGPAHHKRHDIGHQHHDPADQRHHRHAQKRRHVVVGGGDGHLAHVELRAVAEEVRHPLDGDARHLVERLHELEGVLHQEQEHGEEHQQEDDLLHRRHAGAAVHALADLDELHGEHEGEHPAADWQDGALPHAVNDVVHAHGAGAAQHGLEAGGEHALGADGPEHVHLGSEDPVAEVPQHAAKPRVDGVGDVGVRRLRQPEHRRAEERAAREREQEPPLRQRRPSDSLKQSDPLARHGELAVGVRHHEDGPRGVIGMERRRDGLGVEVDGRLAVEGGR